MNDISLNALKRWMAFCSSHGIKFDRIADLGSMNLNGAVKDLLHDAVGFDILPGPGVDVILYPGYVPPEYAGRFDLVTAIGALQCSADPMEFKREATDLLAPGGHFYVITCTPECVMEHTTSDGTKDRHRFTGASLSSLLRPEFRVVSWPYFEEHPMMQLTAVKL